MSKFIQEGKFVEPRRARRIRENDNAYMRVWRRERHRGLERPGTYFSNWTDLKGRVHEGFPSMEEVLAYRHVCARVHRDTRTPCSCYMCGNPRRWFGDPTRQEIVSEMAFEEAISDV
jgi:hypothetical protein